MRPAPWTVDVRLPEKGNSNFHGARPVHQTISMTKWTRASELSIKNSPSGTCSMRKSRALMRATNLNGYFRRNEAYYLNAPVWHNHIVIFVAQRQLINTLAKIIWDLLHAQVEGLDASHVLLPHQSREWNVSKQKWNLCSLE